MVKYENGKIYKIYDNTTGNIYIGSTVNPLSVRLAQHRSHYRQFLDGKRGNVKSFEILKNGEYDIVLMEAVCCENREQLLQRERFHIENNVCINKNIPSRTIQELQEARIKKCKIYNEKNKDKIKEQMRQNYEANKERINAKNREYHEANKEEINARHREYYQAVKKLKQLGDNDEV